MIDALARLPWAVAALLALTVGLAPFLPQPHVWEKLVMLFSGKLRRPIDVFDLCLHGAPWVLLALKAVAAWAARKG